MNRSALLFFVSLLSLALPACAPVAKVAIRTPGEMKLSGVSKIAIMGFNTVDANELGRHAASNEVVHLTRKSIEDVFYRSPFYALVDFDVEDYIINQRKGRPTSQKQKIDAFIYGKVWWEVPPHQEYQNIIPSKMQLDSWRRYTYSYKCGNKTCKGDTELTTETREEAVTVPYRASNASLMLSLSVFKISEGAKIEKLTQVFEIGKHEAIMENAQLSLNQCDLVGMKARQDRAAMLKTKEESAVSGFFNKLLAQPAAEKVTGDLKVAQNLATIPAQLNCKVATCDLLARELNRKITPHEEEFEIPIKAADAVTKNLILYSAHSANIKYIVEKVLGQGVQPAINKLYDLDFEKGVAEAISTLHQRAFEKENREKPEKERKPYLPLTEQQLQTQTRDFLAANIDYLYNMALSEEALGDFDSALAIWRFAFHQFKPADQEFADGIGRSLLALDMADRVTETYNDKVKSRKASYKLVTH